MTEESPFHPGEQFMQERAGVRERAEALGQRVIRDYLPKQHKELYASLPMLLVGGVGADQAVWASPVFGAPGFVEAIDPWRLRVHAVPCASDPLVQGLKPGAAIGVLGLQYETRRRNRLSARVTACDSDGFDLAVVQSFGNCPKYIQTRTLSAERNTPVTAERQYEYSGHLMERARLIIASADHFFIATCYDADADRASRGADVSHRGGRPGFVHIEDERTLTFPDFPGNNHFNTLGNLAMDPRAGLLFIDFDTGDLLHLTGRAEVLWQGDLLAQYPRAERLVQFRVEQCRLLPAAMPWRWSFGEYSPAIDAVAQE